RRHQRFSWAHNACPRERIADRTCTSGHGTAHVRAQLESPHCISFLTQSEGLITVAFECGSYDHARGGEIRMTHSVATFGPLLKRYRVAAGLSQEELAERAGLSRRGISDLERGARPAPHLGTVRSLADGLGLDADGHATLLAAARGQSAPSGATPTLRLGGVPLLLTSFVGREAAVAEVCNRLESARLLTLTGSGGI